MLKFKKASLDNKNFRNCLTKLIVRGQNLLQIKEDRYIKF